MWIKSIIQPYRKSELNYLTLVSVYLIFLFIMYFVGFSLLSKKKKKICKFVKLIKSICFRSASWVYQNETAALHLLCIKKNSKKFSRKIRNILSNKI